MQPDSGPVEYTTAAPQRTSPLLLLVAWLVVGLPATWGVSQTVLRSLDLFTAPVAVPTTAPQAVTR